MWVRVGKWIELSLHFGSPNSVGDVRDTRMIHVAIQLGTREWSRGPRPAITSLSIPSALPALPVQMPSEHEPPTSRRLWR